MTPKLSEEQRKALQEQKGEPIYVVDTEKQVAYVLLPADQYQKLRAIFDDGPFDISETYPLQDQTAEQAWSHPDDAAYDNYDAHRKQ